MGIECRGTRLICPRFISLSFSDSATSAPQLHHDTTRQHHQHHYYHTNILGIEENENGPPTIPIPQTPLHPSPRPLPTPHSHNLILTASPSNRPPNRHNRRHSRLPRNSPDSHRRRNSHTSTHPCILFRRPRDHRRGMHNQ